MLSILIPTYNYNIVSLVDSLHKQLIKTKIAFEIICLDDVSDEEFVQSNIKIDQLPFTTYVVSEQNKGIAVTRQLLTKKAKYDWIILLDADTELIDDRFITKYINVVHSGYDFIFGGFAYKGTKPQSDYLLRWTYGKRCEAVSADKRNKNPYKITIAANVLVKKNIYKSFKLDSIGKQYAMDYYFGAKLKERNSSVLHIDNQVYHLGIEKSEAYLRKKEKAAETLLNLHNHKKINNHSNNLLKTFIILKKLKLNYLFSWFFNVSNKNMKQNLLGSNPWILLLQLYKLSYLCNIDLRKTDI